MGLRETLNKNPSITTGVTAGIILLVAGMVVWEWLSDGEGRAPLGRGQGVTQVFFTTDDGQTWFADDASKLPPFDHGGKPAYRIHLWSTDGGKTVYVSHLERYTRDALKQIEAARASNAPGSGAQVSSLALSGTEVKPPGTGESGWVAARSEQGQKIIGRRDPSGNGAAQEILP